MAGIKKRFDQKGFQMLQDLETALTISEHTNETDLISSIIHSTEMAKPMQTVFKRS